MAIALSLIPQILRLLICPEFVQPASGEIDTTVYYSPLAMAGYQSVKHSKGISSRKGYRLFRLTLLLSMNLCWPIIVNSDTLYWTGKPYRSLDFVVDGALHVQELTKKLHEILASTPPPCIFNSKDFVL